MKNNFTHLLGFTLLTLFILSLSIAVAINFRPLYTIDIDYLNVTAIVDLSKEQILSNYQILLNYLNTPWINNLNMPDFPSSANGLFHFLEVKKLFMLDYLILIFSGIGTSWFIRYLHKKGQVWRLLSYFRWSMLIPLVVLLALLINFDTLFILFHQVFFNNDAWLFNPATDSIILALPAKFFMHSFLLAFGLIEVFVVLSYLLVNKILQMNFSPINEFK